MSTDEGCHCMLCMLFNFNIQDRVLHVIMDTLMACHLSKFLTLSITFLKSIFYKTRVLIY